MSVNLTSAPFLLVTILRVPTNVNADLVLISLANNVRKVLNTVVTPNKEQSNFGKIGSIREIPLFFHFLQVP